MKQNCPCRGCTDRWRDGSKTCHMECTAYNEWRDNRLDLLETVRHKRSMEAATNKIIYSKRPKK